MDQDIEQRVDRASQRDVEPVVSASDANQTAREIFFVRSAQTGASQDVEDPRLAGAAFFEADPAERPTVTHISGNTARTMARTEVHGVHETGETRYFKSLPDSHAPDAEFRAGFFEAMEASISNRLDKVAVGRDGPNVADRLDAGLKDDLEAFARREPIKAASLWADRTEEAAPGPVLQAAMSAREAAENVPDAEHIADPGAKPRVVASGDWVATDRDVDLRPIAVQSDQGLHSGYEARLPGGETDLTMSEQSFSNVREALRHAWDFYEGGEEGLARAVDRVAAMDRDLDDDTVRAPSGLVLEHREQPEFPQPETAIFAGEDAQLVMMLGPDNDANRALAENLVGDPQFRAIVTEHIPEAETALGPGRFVDGESSTGFLPNEVLVVAANDGRDQGDVVAKFPNEGPLSEDLARHLVDSTPVAEHLTQERDMAAAWRDPEREIAAWVAESTARIDRLPADQQSDLRTELQDIAQEAAVAFGLNKTRDANAREEEVLGRPDLADVATRQRLDRVSDQPDGRVAGVVNKLQETVADVFDTARQPGSVREEDALSRTLGDLARAHVAQGSVAFRTEDQARDFSEAMKERYGSDVLKEMASGRTDALAKDVPDPAARQAMAAAVVSAAREHPSLGLDAGEIETAERRMAVAQHVPERRVDHAIAHDQDREL